MWFDRFFARAELPAGLEDELRALAHEGTLVFVMRSAGWLNLSFIRWLVRRLGLRDAGRGARARPLLSHAGRPPRHGGRAARGGGRARAVADLPAPAQRLSRQGRRGRRRRRGSVSRAVRDAARGRAAALPGADPLRLVAPPAAAQAVAARPGARLARGAGHAGHQHRVPAQLPARVRAHGRADRARRFPERRVEARRRAGEAQRRSAARGAQGARRALLPPVARDARHRRAAVQVARARARGGDARSGAAGDDRRRGRAPRAPRRRDRAPGRAQREGGRGAHVAAVLRVHPPARRSGSARGSIRASISTRRGSPRCARPPTAAAWCCVPATSPTWTT